MNEKIEELKKAEWGGWWFDNVEAGIPPGGLTQTCEILKKRWLDLLEWARRKDEAINSSDSDAGGCEG